MYIFHRPVVNYKSCFFERFPCDLIQLQNRAISPEKSFEKREIPVGRNKKVQGYWYLPPFPPPPHKANINTYSSLRANCWLKGGAGGQFPINV